MSNNLNINDLKILHSPDELRKCRIYDAANVINSITNTNDIEFIEKSLYEIMHSVIPDQYDGTIILLGESVIEFNKLPNSIIGFKLSEIFNSSNLHKKDVFRDTRKNTSIFNKDPKISVTVANGQALCGNLSLITVGPMSIGNTIDIQQSVTFDTYRDICRNTEKNFNSSIESLCNKCEEQFKTPFNILRKSTSVDSLRFLDDMTKSFIVDWFKKNNPAGYSQEELDKISSSPKDRDINLLNYYLEKDELTNEEYEIAESIANNIIIFDQASIMFRVMIALYTLFLTSCDKSGVEVYNFKTEVVSINKSKKKKIKKFSIPILRISSKDSLIGRFSTANFYSKENPLEKTLQFIGDKDGRNPADDIPEEFFVMHGMS